MTTREQVIQSARELVGLPFAHGGRGKRIDCVGIPLLVARDLKVAGWQRLWHDPECHEYPKVRPPGFLRAKLDSFVESGILRHVELQDLEPADLVLRWVSFGRDHHVSLLTGERMMIEARCRGEARHPSGRIVETAITPIERRTFAAGYQFAGVA